MFVTFATMFLPVLNGIIVGLTASITVGPVAILCIQRALTRDRRSAFVSGLGVVFADTLMAAISYFLYSLVYNKIEEYKPILGVIGGIIVIIFGVYMIKKNVVKDLRRNRNNKNSLWQDFASVVGLTLSNFIGAMTYIFAFFAMFDVGAGNVEITNSSELLRGLLVLFGFIVGSFCWWTTLTSAFGFFRKKVRPRHFIVINRIGGSIILVLGVYTIISTFVEII